MIINARSDCNSLSFTWHSASPRTWSILVQQLSCGSAWRPPADCLQWFTGASGVIQSFNFAGGMHLASHQYNVCIRSEQGRCSIKYSAVSDQLQLSGATSPAAGLSGDACSLDYITISGGGATAGADSSSYDRFCGMKLTLPPSSTTSVTVFTNVSPFMVGVHLDGSEVNPSTTSTEASLGFSLNYEQIQCN